MKGEAAGIFQPGCSSLFWLASYRCIDEVLLAFRPLLLSLRRNQKEVVLKALLVGRGAQKM